MLSECDLPFSRARESGQLISLREHNHQKSEIFFCRCSRHLSISVRQGITGDPFRPSEPMEAADEQQPALCKHRRVFSSNQIRFSQRPRPSHRHDLCHVLLENRK
jgi:hypothetical protein